MRSPRLASLAFIALTLAVSPALAQSRGSSSSGLDSPAASSSGSGSSVRTVSADHSLDDDQATIEEDGEDEGEPTVADDGVNPRELPDHDYYFTGAFFRGVIIPGFMQDVFVHYEGGTPVNFGGGAFFGWRRNGFNVRAEVWYEGFGNVGYYRGRNDPDYELERVQSDLGVVFGSFLFGWTFQINEYFGIDLGFGLGLGGLTGNMWRQEAYRRGGGGPSGTPAECTEPGAAGGDATYCEGDGIPAEDRHTNHDTPGPTYQRFCASNPSAPECLGSSGLPSPFYFGDGGVPPMFFWIDLPRIGVTIKPIRQFEIRIDGGYNLYGFNFGASMGVGF